MDFATEETEAQRSKGTCGHFSELSSWLVMEWECDLKDLTPELKPELFPVLLYLGDISGFFSSFLPASNILYDSRIYMILCFLGVLYKF